mgnify:CR=1 FL=1
MNNQYNGHLCIVFALEHYNPLNMIRALGENGINPVYISVKRRYEVATKSKYISELHRVDCMGIKQKRLARSLTSYSLTISL